MQWLSYWCVIYQFVDGGRSLGLKTIPRKYEELAAFVALSTCPRWNWQTGRCQWSSPNYTFLLAISWPPVWPASEQTQNIVLCGDDEEPNASQWCWKRLWKAMQEPIWVSLMAVSHGWETLIYMTHSQVKIESFLAILFHSKLSMWVNTTHYFFTQRVCLLLLVFISINFMSAGLTQITTSMSCTFDLKIKLIWEVFKALLIFIWPLTVAMRFTSFFLKLELLLPIQCLSTGSFSDHLILTFFLKVKSTISQKVIAKLVLVSPPFIMPIWPNESDLYNMFLSLTSFRNSKAIVSLTKTHWCWVTTKHYFFQGWSTSTADRMLVLQIQVQSSESYMVLEPIRADFWMQQS